MLRLRTLADNPPGRELPEVEIVVVGNDERVPVENGGALDLQ